MGILTGDMTRLCDETNAWRGAREVLMKNLTRGAKDLQKAVSEMEAGFHNGHTQMARKAKAERNAFVSGLKRTVLSLRKEFSDDLTGARRAWCGSAPPKPVAGKWEEPRAAETEMSTEERRSKEAEGSGREEKAKFFSPFKISSKKRKKGC